MRPRHKAAEYLGVEAVGIGFAGGASMRPRHKAAEYDTGAFPARQPASIASMRPRHKAAEYRPCDGYSIQARARFNEAAA